MPPEGSPPRMRGKPSSGALSDAAGGITPADAGKTLFAISIARLYWDHPRGCGENAPARSSSSPTQGSPPRMRGKPFAPRRYHYRVGITPADAGKTFCLNGQNPPTGDHPRGCGENVFVRMKRAERNGSPPRMRGKLSYICPLCSKYGITPADAGKTCISRGRHWDF